MKTYCRVWLSTACLLLIAAGSGEGATRVAVVTTGGKTAAGDVAVFVETRLAEGNSVEVLDRTEIDRVLAEQRLSLQAGVAADQAVRAGRLLKCDLLVVIEQTPDFVKPAARRASGENAAQPEIPSRPKPATGTQNKGDVHNKDGAPNENVRSAERPDYGSPTAPSVGKPAGSPVDAKPLLSLIAFDAATGLRLWDEALPGDTLDESVAAAVSGARQAVRKQQRNLAVGDLNQQRGPVEPLKLVSLVGARNAELPRSFDSLCDSVSSLLERRLVSSANIGVLERSHLKHLNEEQALIGEATAARVLAATVLIDLQFEKAGRSLRVKALLTDANGREVGTVSVDERELDAKTIQLLADRVLVALHAAPVRDNETTPKEAASDEALAAQRSRESDRFYREARLMQSFKHPDRALRSAESAVLLDPRPDRRALLARLLFEEATRELGPAYAAARPPSDISPFENIFERPPVPIANDLLRRAASLGGRALDLVLEFKPVIGEESPDGPFGERTLQQVEQPLTSYISLMLHCVPASPEGTLVEQVRSQHQAAIRRQLGLLEAWHEGIRREPQLFIAYSFVMWMRCFQHSPNPLREVMPTDIPEFERLSARHLSQWWEMASQAGDEHFKFVPVVVPDLARRRWPEADSRDAILPTLEAMARHERPVFRWYARLALLKLDWLDVKQYTVDHIAAFQQFRRDIESEMAAPRHAKDAATRRIGYEVLTAGLESMANGAPFVEQADEWLDVCHNMLERGEIFPGLLHAAQHYRLRFGNRLDQQPFLDELDRAVKLARPTGGGVVLLQSSSRNDLANLERLREHLLHQRPELSRRLNADSLEVDVRTLLDLPRENPRDQKSWRMAMLCRWIVEGDCLYGAVLKSERGQARIEAITVTLPDGLVSVLGSTELGFLNGGTESVKLIPAVCLTDDAFVVAHRTLGLFAFARNGSGTVNRLAAHVEFPSKGIESLAHLDGRFYAGLEGGYLVEFKQHEADCRVIASSRRKEKLSSLDDRAVFTIERLAVDAERHRLLFVAATPPGATGERPPAEFWEYRLDAEAPRRLIAITDRGVIGTNELLFGDHLLLQGVGWMIDFNARTDVALGISNHKFDYANPMPMSIRTDIIPYRPAVRLADAYWSVTDFGTGPGEVRFNGTATFSRVRFDPPPQRNAGSYTNTATTSDVATEPPPTPKVTSPSHLKEERIRIVVDPLPAKAKREDWLLEPFGNDRLLWSDHHRLWLLALKKPANDESPPSVP